VHVAVAALAMVATLPGRTQGLGLFTVSIMGSLRLDQESYAFINLWATLLGGLFCLPCGGLIDRFGTRRVLTVTTVCLGAVVIAMSQVQGAWVFPLTLSFPWEEDAAGSFSVILMLDLFLLILLTRGLGQSALSVASLSLIGRSAGRRTGLAMGVYAFLTSAGFVAAFGVLRQVIKSYPDEWRPTWAGIGLAVIGAGVLCGVLIRNRLLDADPARHAPANPDAPGEVSRTLGQALRSPAFWTVSLSTSFFGLVSAGIGLFNQPILAERGFGREVFLNIVVLGIPVGLASNLLCGWLATRWPLARLLALAMGVLGLTLLAFPQVEGEGQVYLYAAALAAAGGAITVCFFTAWRRGFGPAHLGRIQGAAQLLTVVFSALGPQLFASIGARLHSYLPLFPWLAAVSLGLAAATWLAPLPGRN
jgi:sugar phosphate permease